MAFARSRVPGIVAVPVHGYLRGLEKNCCTPSLHSLQLKAINTKDRMMISQHCNSTESLCSFNVLLLSYTKDTAGLSTVPAGFHTFDHGIKWKLRNRPLPYARPVEKQRGLLTIRQSNTGKRVFETSLSTDNFPCSVSRLLFGLINRDARCSKDSVYRLQTDQ